MNLRKVDQEQFTKNVEPLWKKQKWPPNNDPSKEEFSYLLYTEDNILIGGISGEFRWDWCYVAKLVIDPQFQGKGYGSKLLAHIEKQAQEKGMIGINLSTFSYQAPKFYESLGYSVFGELQHRPNNHSTIYYQKKLP